MDRLETFFINTVVAAQKQRKPTSGAVSTTGIGDFLTSQETGADILDKLVSAPVSQRSAAAPSADAEPETAEAGPDDQLLDKLTAQDEPNLPKAEPEGGVGDEESRAEQVEGDTEPDQQVEKSILEKLTNEAPRHKGQGTGDESDPKRHEGQGQNRQGD
jgi:hypothetical protein